MGGPTEIETNIWKQPSPANHKRNNPINKPVKSLEMREFQNDWPCFATD